ncbi:NYN domain-containing protein [Anatilimnocola floriformis]|uniref:NYN domain-containing protein n=1 Tax=Anatilimnocola floriformis TaxID=2948575 RepID=UPI0020C50041|nr:NYN domain-containing protein [Anatilimnocola floriformis]
MKLLVDGYNLLHASGVFGSPTDPPTLETARRALIDFLAQHLPERERTRTTIVFDGKDAPPGLPAEGSHEKMRFVFSRRKTTADELIAEMIAAEKDPRQLFVVSSDHGVQRAARQRGVSFEDSEVWTRELRTKASAVAFPTEKTEPTQSAADIAHWLREFSPSPPHKTPSSQKSSLKKSSSKKKDQK